MRIKRAIVSVFNKEGIVEFARGLEKFGVEILSTGGTKSLLKKEGISVKSITDYTGAGELLSGRVKTLHPKIHAGLLARRDDGAHLKELKSKNIPLIDLVVCNFYPFEKVVTDGEKELAEILENIDIGGPTMVRAAAKNYPGVAVITDPGQYNELLDELNKNNGELDISTCRRFAQIAWRKIADYDNIISEYFNNIWVGASPTPTRRGDPRGLPETDEQFPQRIYLELEKVQDLRYGENPHQKAALYKSVTRPFGYPRSPVIGEQIKQLHGKELSYNNLVDLDAAWGLLSEFEQPTAAVIKHASPCGVATNKKLVEAYKNAFACDSVSAFGSIVGFNREVDINTAAEISKTFVECVLAPEFSKEALEILKRKKNLRLIQAPITDNRLPITVYKRVFGGFFLTQEKDVNLFAGLKTVTNRQPTEEEMKALEFAWKVCKWVKSNAIVIATRDRTLGIGTGQPSRVDSVKIAAMKFHRLPITDYRLPVVLASDAFFPFRDGIDEAAKAGVTAVIQPGGSIRDQEVIAACNEHKIALIFAGMRHFRH